MKRAERVFVAAWDYPPVLSGESIVCRRTLEHSTLPYDVCCGPQAEESGGRIRLFPVKGHKYLLWPFRAAACFRRLNEQEHYRVMMSRVMPPNGHLAGWLIKRSCPSVKWAAYFSDPVWNSPFLKFSLRRTDDHRPRWLLMKLFGLPAKWAVRESDLLIFNNERLARRVVGKDYERFQSKILIAPYGHDGVRPRPPVDRGDGRFLLTHVGQIYGDRTLEALTEGLALLKEREPEAFRHIRVRQVGFISETERRRAEQSAAAEAFEFVGQVPYEESLEEMARADCLLVIDPVFDDPAKKIYVPGKLYDYLSAGRPILCLADRDSATGDVASAAGLSVCPPAGEEIYQVLCRGLNGELTIPDPAKLKPFSCQVGAALIDSRIKELCSE